MTKKILIVDDEPGFIHPHHQALVDEGYEVKVSRNVDEAFEILQDHLTEGTPFDLITLDLLMPPSANDKDLSTDLELRKTGVRLHKRIRFELNIQTPIIFITVIQNAAIRQELEDAEIKLGCSFNFMSKPLGTNKLLAKVKNILKK